jgi:hypothetical protein
MFLFYNPFYNIKVIHQSIYRYLTPHSTPLSPMWLKPNHLHQNNLSSHQEIYIGTLKLKHWYLLVTPACLQSVCGLWFFLTNQSFNNGSLSFEHIHPNIVHAQLTSILELGMYFWSFAKPRKKVFYTSSSKHAYAIQHALMQHSKYLMSKWI